ncbi:MAG: MFS transporter [Myxococcales bacterium]|nr:MFS transporter [Myxococcales bacterium]MDD9966998.1 MFS transporter [Myxococcales bacterium]
MASNGERRLTILTKVAFGIGQMAEGIKNVAFSMFVVFYYNQVLGLDPALAGLAAALALFFDAITDPLAGALSDSFRSRWGRRHPFMVVSSVPLAVTFFFLFAPPPGLEGGALFAWLLVMAILVRGAMTFYHVPHLALGAELAPDYRDRTTIFTYSTMFGFLGGLGMRSAALPLFFPSSQNGLQNAEAYPRFAMSMAIIMMVSILVCAWGTRSEIPHLPQASGRQRFSFSQMIGALWGLLGYKSFRSIFLGMATTTLIFGIEIFMYTYMGKFFWELTEEQLGLLGLATVVGLPAAFFVVPWMTRRLDKRNALVSVVVILILASNIPIISRLVGVFPENGSPILLPLLIAFRLVFSVLSPALYILPQSMFADIGDEVALATGKRLEGVIFSARSLIGKGVIAIGTALGGVALKVIEFPAKAVPGEVDPSVVFNLGVVEGPATSVFTLLGLTFYMAYPLNAARHAEIQAALEKKKAHAQTSADAEGEPTMTARTEVAALDNA